MLKLPKGRLSYSAIDLWLKSRNSYRDRYYRNEPFIETPEILFGRNLALLLEADDASVKHIPRLSKAEQKLECVIGDVPMIGFLDTFEPGKNEFGEYKSGRTKWDQVRVNKHLQLDFYSLMIETIYGSVTDKCHLYWIETNKKIEKKIVMGHEMDIETKEIMLTGPIHVFERVITKKDRDFATALISKVGREISDDYSAYLARSSATLPSASN